MLFPFIISRIWRYLVISVTILRRYWAGAIICTRDFVVIVRYIIRKFVYSVTIVWRFCSTLHFFLMTNPKIHTFCGCPWWVTKVFMEIVTSPGDHLNKRCHHNSINMLFQHWYVALFLRLFLTQIKNIPMIHRHDHDCWWSGWRRKWNNFCSLFHFCLIGCMSSLNAEFVDRCAWWNPHE